MAFATTCHKFQGQTVPRGIKLIIDLRQVWIAAMAYVMLSRVMELKQVFIIGELNEKKIYPAPAALEELNRMNEVSINNNPSNWNNETFEGLKISSLNCRSIRSKIEDIRKDFELSFSDIICLSETWIEENDDLADLQMNDYILHANSAGRGKGLATYFKNGKFSHEVDRREDLQQISKFSSEKLDVVSIYRSKECKENLQDTLETIITKKKPTLLLGDFNICFRKK